MVKWTFLTGLNQTTVENCGDTDVVVFLWWCCGCVLVVVFLWWCGGVFVVVWWCSCGGVLWW